MALPQRDWREGLREAGPLLALGWQILGAMAFFGGGGVWLDLRFGTMPWLTLLGMLLAAVAVGALLYRIVQDSKRPGTPDR